MDAALVAALAAQAAELDDQTEVVSNDFPDRRIPPAGRSVARLIEYIELGMQKQRPYQGKEKPDADNVRLVFELLSGHNITEATGQDGKPIKFADRISLTLKKSLGAKASYRKLFDVMRYGRDGIKHMAQMLNHPFIIDIVHNEKKDGEGKVVATYANMSTKEKGWLIQGPFVTDPLTNATQDLSSQVPAAISPLRIFVWDLANKETWDSLFIEGETEIKDEKTGAVIGTKSKNWLQETILKASNFQGSPLEALLGGLPTLGLPDTNGDPLVDTASTAGTQAPASPQPSATASLPTSAPAVPTNSAQSQLPPNLTLEQFQAYQAYQAAQAGQAAPVTAPAASTPSTQAAPAASAEPPKKGRGRPKKDATSGNGAAAATPSSTPATIPAAQPAISAGAPAAPSANAALAALGL